jgi:hypothetical protein
MRRFVVGAAAIFAALAMGAGPAWAQFVALSPIALTPTQSAELTCTRAGLTKADSAAFVKAYFSKEGDDQASALIAKPAQACKAKHKWSEERVRLASTLAQNAIIIDELTAQLVADGMKDADTVQRTWFGLAGTERAKLLTPRWANDTVVLVRLQMALVEAGVPNKPEALTDAMIVLEATSHAVATSNAWAQIKP